MSQKEEERDSVIREKRGNKRGDDQAWKMEEVIKQGWRNGGDQTGRIAEQRSNRKERRVEGRSDKEK